jgi:carbon-monoxide dehydrogenase medium subunit
MKNIELHEPRTVQEAASILAQHADEAKVIAGGTALVIMLKNNLIAPGHLVSLGRITDLNYLRYEEGTGLRIGALTTIREVELSPLVREKYPTLASTMGKVANVRVRNAATVGGNMAEADYASDPPCVLVAMRAKVKAASARGEREIPLTEFFRDFYETALEHDEVVTEVVVPPPSPQTRSTYIKYITRSSEDRPCVGTAAFVDVDQNGVCQDLRVVIGAVAEKPQELAEAEALARGRQITEELAREIGERYADAIDPLSDLRGSAWYRKQMIRVFVRRAIMQALDGGSSNGRS